MKRMYVTPEVEKIEFQFRDQVVVASGVTSCEDYKITYAHTHYGQPGDGDTGKCDNIVETGHEHFKDWPCTFGKEA